MWFTVYEELLVEHLRLYTRLWFVARCLKWAEFWSRYSVGVSHGDITHRLMSAVFTGNLTVEKSALCFLQPDSCWLLTPLLLNTLLVTQSGVTADQTWTKNVTGLRIQVTVECFSPRQLFLTSAHCSCWRLCWLTDDLLAVWTENASLIFTREHITTHEDITSCEHSGSLTSPRFLCSSVSSSWCLILIWAISCCRASLRPESTPELKQDQDTSGDTSGDASYDDVTSGEALRPSRSYEAECCRVFRLLLWTHLGSCPLWASYLSVWYLSDRTACRSDFSSKRLSETQTRSQNCPRHCWWSAWPDRNRPTRCHVWEAENLNLGFCRVTVS